jgi:hypothetical protein
METTESTTQKTLVPACPYCNKPIEAPITSKIFDRAYDNVLRKQYARTRVMVFCSNACASNMQMSCEG